MLRSAQRRWPGSPGSSFRCTRRRSPSASSLSTAASYGPYGRNSAIEGRAGGQRLAVSLCALSIACHSVSISHRYNGTTSRLVSVLQHALCGFVNLAQITLKRNKDPYYMNMKNLIPQEYKGCLTLLQLTAFQSDEEGGRAGDSNLIGNLIMLPKVQPTKCHLMYGNKFEGARWSRFPGRRGTEFRAQGVRFRVWGF